ncbi:SRPBCC family protein [Amycolatopsis mongoliensis]|uniref:SRPBCC family protein n=1 Tax=Amycolatopsis mongoliensis TaxID=715475 RepID=A0A9Y2JMN1_9PSEU|nr:SRPBCC family protein [Amycolatopsis sp. 4-36]WIY00833.1 SRPBCC family protein [Amycolatopsis sp. 4-36]
MNITDDPGTSATIDVTGFAFTRSAWVDAAPAHVYELISDVSAIGRWSPTASSVSYDDGAGPRAGAWFSGANRRDGREWTTRSQVERADPGTAFTFVVGGTETGIVRWSWEFRPQGRGSLVRQSWQLLRFDPVLGRTRADVDALRQYMAGSVETTLAALAQWIAEHHREPGCFPRGSRAEGKNAADLDPES